MRSGSVCAPRFAIGPLRLDYGINPTPEANEDFGAFHFSFGFAF